MTAPVQPRLVENDLNGIIASLIGQGVGDDTNFSILKRVGQFWEITFDGAEHISIAFDSVDYPVIHRELAEKRSYNVKFLDGGLLQLLYRFNENTLLQHRLTYLPSPDLRSFREDPEGYMRDELYIEIVSRHIVPFPLRFDYDNRDGVSVDMMHPKTHLTLGDVKDCRIPVTSPLTPRWFVEFILSNFYRTDHYDFVAGLPNHLFRFEPSITANELGIIHVTVPQ